MLHFLLCLCLNTAPFIMFLYKTFLQICVSPVLTSYPYEAVSSFCVLFSMSSLRISLPLANKLFSILPKYAFVKTFEHLRRALTF
jgi:hypothetical protein